MSGLFLTLVIGVLVNLFTLLFSREKALKLIPWLCLYIGIYGVAILLTTDYVRSVAMEIAKNAGKQGFYHWSAYVVVIVISAVLGGLYWRAINVGVDLLAAATAHPKPAPISTPAVTRFGSPLPSTAAAVILLDSKDTQVGDIHAVGGSGVGLYAQGNERTKVGNVTTESASVAVLRELKEKVGQDAGNVAEVKKDFQWARKELEPEWSSYSPTNRADATKNFDVVAKAVIKSAKDKAATLALLDKIIIQHRD